MRCSALAIAASVGVAIAGWPQLAVSQNERDFVFTDVDGHLVLRFAGTPPGGLDAHQTEEIVNVQLSTMVHDRLRADAEFEAEPVDAAWAGSMAPRIERHMRETAPEFSAIRVECRLTSCRILLDHADTWRVSEHQSLMGVAQRAFRAFIEADAPSFEPVFLIAAHYQEPESAYMKIFLRRAAARSHAGQRAGG
jgi:hypothetical protein